jgi:hypothetical protein
MPLRSSLSSRLLRNNTQAQSLVDHMEDARSDLASGPEILSLVSELAVLCEDLFETHTLDASNSGDARAPHYQQEHEDFLSAYADYAEQIRATNGELSDEFFEFLQQGRITTKHHAA